MGHKLKLLKSERERERARDWKREGEREREQETERERERARDWKRERERARDWNRERETEREFICDVNKLKLHELHLWRKQIEIS